MKAHSRAVPRTAALLALSVSALASGALQAQPVREAKSLLLDLSSESLIDAESAKAVLKDNIPAKVWKLYPEGKYTFLSQVAGGLTPDGICAVTARVVLLPRTGTVRAVLWRPQQRTTVFDARPGSNAEQCKALAKDKLKEATSALVASLVKT